ncbi:MAG: pyruvate formate lyase family protein, partial [Tissierellaceae bacterium]
MKQWEGFKKGSWTEEINVRDFILLNYSPYEGNEDFLAEPTERTKSLWKKTEDLIKKEILNKEVEICTRAFSGIANHEPGYLDRENELIVGYQTDKPLKRLVNPYGGYRMVRNSLDAYGAEMDDTLEKHFNEFRKTHNQGVFDAYTEEMRKARTVGLLTGLPDAYGRGRIIGDYRRIPLYGIDFLKAEKIKDKKNIKGPATEEIIRLREDVSEQ